jgi:pilus assembly protein CpaF
MAVDIRTFGLQAHSLDELVATRTLTAQAARFLEAAVAAWLEILVSGDTQAGKTTLLNCLVAAVRHASR